MKSGRKNFGRGVLFFLAWIFLWGMTMGSDQVLAAEAMNVRLVGHNDLQGRETLQVVFRGITPMWATIRGTSLTR